MRLIYLGSAFILGVLLGSIVYPFVPLLLVLLAIFLALSLALVALRKHRFLLALLCLSALLGGALRYSLNIPKDGSLGYYNGVGTVEIKGIIANDPEPRGAATWFYLDATEVKTNSSWQTTRGSTLVYAKPSPRILAQRDGPYFRYGDLLHLRGKLEETSTLGGFDYQEYLARQGISSTMHYPQVELLGSAKRFKPLAWVYALRWRMADALNSALPEPHASLAQASILGIRSTLPPDFKDALSKTGTTHIIAISGLNISIIIGIVASFALWCFGRRRYLHLILPLMAAWGYSILAGMSPSVVRAAIMGSLYLLAIAVGRQGSASIALVASAGVMVGLEPGILWDISFQLSFLAMAGLIFLAPPLQSAGARIAGKLGIHPKSWGYGPASFVNESIAVTLAATLATLPIIAFNFHRVSLVGVPATLLILPSLPFLLVTSFMTAFAGIVLPPMGQVFGWAAWLGLTYMIALVELFSRVPLAAIELRAFSETLVWGYYGILAAFLWAAHNSKAVLASSQESIKAFAKGIGVLANPPASKLTSKWSIILLSMTTALVWSAALATPDGRLHVSFLDVGQGDAILVQAPSHKKVLIDGGPSPQAIVLGLSKKLPFWDRTIDLIVLTHPHEDHLTGLLEVVRRYKVKMVVESSTPYSSASYEEWLSLLEKKKIPTTRAISGQEIRLGKGTSLKVLNPQEKPLEGTASDADNNSVVLRLEYGSATILFSGEIQEEAELYLLGNSSELQSTLLKVSHHGSRTSTSSEFLEAVKAQVAVISVGANNRFGHPHPDTMARLRKELPEERIFLTSETGTVEAISDGRSLWVKKER